MKTNTNWKIKVAFIITPILSLGMFALTYYVVWYSDNKPPFGVYLFLGLFGLIGIWTASVALMKGKSIDLKKNNITVSRFFKTKEEFILGSEIDYVQNFIKSENPFMNYELVVFRTTSRKEFWIVSYEFNNYLKLKKWLFQHSKNSDTNLYSTKDFLLAQYLKPLLLSIFLFAIIILPLCVKTFYNNVYNS